MIELVFVIVVLGILASLAMGRMDRDLRQEAAETILSHIRLTQQLALRDNKHRGDNDAKWQTAYWQFAMKACGDDIAYRVASDISLGGTVNGITSAESAINPIDGKFIFSKNCTTLEKNETSSVLLSKKFGIYNTGVNFSHGCDRKQITFDYLGRPHTQSKYSSADFSHIMTSDCNMSFTLSTDSNNDGVDDTFSIIVKAETGHAFIVGQEAL